MAKSRRTAPPDAPRTTRTTVEVRPSWLEEVPDEASRPSRASKARPSRATRPSEVGRPSIQRPTIEVQDEWLEAGSRPPSRAPAEPAAKRVVPPPLPASGRRAPSIEAAPDDEDEEPQRSAIPPPLPASEAAKKPRR